MINQPPKKRAKSNSNNKEKSQKNYYNVLSKDDKNCKTKNISASNQNKIKRGKYKNKNLKDEFQRSIQYVLKKENNKIWKFSLSS